MQEDQGPSLSDLADAATVTDRSGAPSLLLSAEAKAAGVACSPAQLFFVAQHLVRCTAEHERLLCGIPAAGACMSSRHILLKSSARGTKQAGVWRNPVGTELCTRVLRAFASTEPCH